MANTRHGKIFRIIFGIFLFMAITLMAKNIYQKHAKIQELSQESSCLDDKLTKVSDKIVSMKRDIQIAKNDPHVIEHKAKDNFMMVRKNETVIMFKDN